MMACVDKLVVCLKVNGKVLREHQGAVLLPYSSEYSILVKNLNSVRAEVDLTIDGRAVFPNSSLIVGANSETTVERFVENNNSGNRFKFIERTGNIENHRGVKADDGLIRVAFRFEKVVQAFIPPFKIIEHHHYHDKYGHPPYVPHSPVWYGLNSDRSVSRGLGSEQIGSLYSSNTMGVGGSSAQNVVNSAQDVPMASCNAFTSTTTTCDFSAKSAPQNLKANHPLVGEVGITVEGSKSNQYFQTVSSFPTEDQEHVLVLRLLGDIGQNKRVEKPITVKMGCVCGTCGRRNKVHAKFCSECGTAVGIELVA